jgi:hypothetical protein
VGGANASGHVFVFFVALFFYLLTVPAFADNRIALVIANGTYARAPFLPNPLHDAEDVAAALRLATDLDKTGMDEAMIRFASFDVIGWREVELSAQ